MANKDVPRGLWPIRNANGGELRSTTYVVTTGQTIYRGDVLKVVAAGTVEESDANDGVIVIGVAAEYVDDSGSAGGKTIAVFDDPNTVFGVQGYTTYVSAAADVFSTANHVAGSGSTTSFISGHELGATASGGQLEIIGLVDDPQNTWGEHANLEVIFAEHKRKAAVAGV